MANIQEIRTQLIQLFYQLGTVQQRNKFMYSCMSEGLLPKGFQIFFNLANFVNNQNLVKEIQGVIEANFKFKISDFFLPLVQTFSVSFFITPEQVTFKFPFQFD